MPRIDIVPPMTAMLGSHVRVDEFGALDALDAAARAALAPHEGGGHHRFVTRLRDGGSIELDKDATEARLADVMRQADGAGYDLLVPLCTGTALPRLRTRAKFASFLEADRRQWSATIKAANIKAE